jgi:hypothetical protein
MLAAGVKKYAAARETNRKPDARPMEARRCSRIGLAMHLAVKRSRSRKEDCRICDALRIPAEILHKRNVRHLR